MHVIIGGCGRVGAEVATQLSNQAHDVVVIDQEPARLDDLGSGFNGETVLGDVTDEAALLEAGLAYADAVVAVTDSDNANLMTVEIATALYDVEHTVARLANPQREASYRRMGVHYVLGTRLFAKTIINELHAGAFPQHVAFEDGEVEVVEMLVTHEGHGVALSEFEASGYLRVAAVRRGTRVRIPAGDERLQAGDLLVGGARRGVRRKLRGLVANPLVATHSNGRGR